MDELEEAIAAGRLQDFPAFEKAANEMLDACAVFWEVGDAPEIQWRFDRGAASGILAEMRSERRVCTWRRASRRSVMASTTRCRRRSRSSCEPSMDQSSAAPQL